jgi:DNA helicase II / ATP-dependent DNA helicase PcrA
MTGAHATAAASACPGEAASDGSASASYLADLNPEQRAAVLHGDGNVAGPLLLIAGAGSGKTNTLAHRVAHLVVQGADPRRCCS